MLKIQDNQNSIALYDTLGQSLEKYDILVDTRQGKLFMGGTKISSQELQSQQFTASVLEKHVSDNVKSISSKTLPVSSYSKSKSEFMGKIGYPLQKCIQDKIGKSFVIKCDGVGSTFVAHLDYKDISIGCII